MSDPFDLKQSKDVQIISFSKLVFGVAFGIITAYLIVALVVGAVYLSVGWFQAAKDSKRRKENIALLEKQIEEHKKQFIERDAILKRLQSEDATKKEVLDRMEAENRELADEIDRLIRLRLTNPTTE